MAIGDLFDNTSANNTPTIDKLNAKCLVEGTGAYLATISSGSVSKGTIAFCSTTGSGFTAGVYYGRNSTNTAWVAIAGGLRNLLLVGITDAYFLSYPCTNKDEFIAATSGGTVSTDTGTGGPKLNTGSTTSQWANIALEGMQTSFDTESKLLIKVDCSSGDNIRARHGIAMDSIEASGSTTQRHYGIEVDATTTALNWSIISCDGTTRSATTTGKAASTGGARRHLLHFTPGTDIKFYDNGTLDTTKTTNIPSSGNNGGARVFSAGVLTKEGLDKQLRIFGMEYIGKKAEAF